MPISSEASDTASRMVASLGINPTFGYAAAFSLRVSIRVFCADDRRDRLIELLLHRCKLGFQIGDDFLVLPGLAVQLDHLHGAVGDFDDIGRDGLDGFGTALLADDLGELLDGVDVAHGAHLEDVGRACRPKRERIAHDFLAGVTGLL